MTIPPGWGLPASLRALVGQSTGRQRAMLEAGHLLVVLHRVPGANDMKREGVLFWRAPPVSPDETVPGETPEAQWKSTSAKDGLPSMRLHLLEYERAVAELEKRYQGAQNARDLFEILQGVAPIHRAATNLGNALQSATNLVPEAVELLPLRDQAGDFERAAELLQTDAKNALDYQIARGNDESARVGARSRQIRPTFEHHRRHHLATDGDCRGVRHELAQRFGKRAALAVLGDFCRRRGVRSGAEFGHRALEVDP